MRWRRKKSNPTEFKNVVENIKKSFESVDRENVKKLKALFTRCTGYKVTLTKKAGELKSKIEHYDKVIEGLVESHKEMKGKLEAAADVVSQVQGKDDLIRIAVSDFQHIKFKSKTIVREKRDCTLTKQLIANLHSAV